MLICGFTNRNIKYIMDVTDEIALIGNTMLFYDLVAVSPFKITEPKKIWAALLTDECNIVPYKILKHATSAL